MKLEERLGQLHGDGSSGQWEAFAISVGGKEHLLGRLIEGLSATHAVLEGVDLEMRVYGDTGWRIRDILGHIATWDRQVAKSLRAFRAGTEYSVPGVDGDETEFNAQEVSEQAKRSTRRILAEWEEARADLQDALSEILLDRFPGDLLYPWGDERGSISRLIEYMIDHYDEHRDEVIEAIKVSAET